MTTEATPESAITWEIRPLLYYVRGNFGLAMTGPAVGDELPRLADLGLKGRALVKTFTHFEKTSSDHQQVVDEWALQLVWERRLGTWGAAKIVSEFRDDDFGFTRGLHFQIPETTLRRSYLNLRGNPACSRSATPSTKK